MDPPLFSVVTPALNCLACLPRNVASVRGQGLPSGQIEHWIIDGGSTDGTAEWLRQQADVHYVSEKDHGLSEAVNKGIRRAQGQWILWINADDELAPGALPGFLEAIAAHPGRLLFCGAQKVFGYDGTLESVTPPIEYRLEHLLGRRTAISQASTFVHRQVYAAVGLLDETFRYAMDYEWVVRAVRVFPCQPLPLVLTHYHRRRGSITDAGTSHQHREFLRVRRQQRCSYLAPAEFVFRFYLATEPLRRIDWLRRAVRRVKRALGLPLPHAGTPR